MWGFAAQYWAEWQELMSFLISKALSIPVNQTRLE